MIDLSSKSLDIIDLLTSEDKLRILSSIVLILYFGYSDLIFETFLTIPALGF
jgi:hypothetical protein